MTAATETPIFHAMTYTEPGLWTDTLPAIATDDSIPNRTEGRAIVCAAITRCAAEHGGLVHASWVRPYIASTVYHKQVGSIFSALRGTKHLEGTDLPPLEMGGTGGNATKLSRVTRLVRPIEAIA